MSFSFLTYEKVVKTLIQLYRQWPDRRLPSRKLFCVAFCDTPFSTLMGVLLRCLWSQNTPWYFSRWVQTDSDKQNWFTNFCSDFINSGCWSVDGLGASFRFADNLAEDFFPRNRSQFKPTCRDSAWREIDRKLSLTRRGKSAWSL